MPYTIIIKKQAHKTLKSLSSVYRHKITEKIIRLGNDLDDIALDIKPLQASLFYRLRVGQWRIIFDRQNEVKVIAIEKIKPRGDAYK